MVDSIAYALRTWSSCLAVDTSGYGEGGWIDGASSFGDHDYRDLAEHIWWALLMDGEVSEDNGLSLYRVTAPHMVAGFLVNPDTGLVEESAPILKWAIGKHLLAVEDWAADNGHEVKRV